MCVIFGIIGLKEIDSIHFKESLRHSGPDAYGHLNHSCCNKYIFMMHTRLSIIDLSPAGNQPMITDDDNLTIIYNGEVYNVQDIRAEYLTGFTFHSQTDTETVLYLYNKFVIDLSSSINQ